MITTFCKIYTYVQMVKSAFALLKIETMKTNQNYQMN